MDISCASCESVFEVEGIIEQSSIDCPVCNSVIHLEMAEVQEVKKPSVWFPTVSFKISSIKNADFFGTILVKEDEILFGVNDFTSTGRMAGQALGGALFGVVGAIAGGAAARKASSLDNYDFPFLTVKPNQLVDKVRRSKAFKNLTPESVVVIVNKSDIHGVDTLLYGYRIRCKKNVYIQLTEHKKKMLETLKDFGYKTAPRK